MTAAPPNKRMQRARDPDKCVLCLGHQRVTDARRLPDMRSLIAIAIGFAWTMVVHADPSLVGHWVSDRDASAAFNEEHVRLEERTASFLRQSMGRLNVIFTASTVAWHMPNFDATIAGEKHSIAGFDESDPYEVLGSTQNTVAIRTKEPVSGADVIYVYTFEGPNKMWVYVSTLGTHLREYFTRAG